MKTDIMARLAQEQHQTRQRVRKAVAESGHPDAAAHLREMDRNLWDTETGVASARSTWVELSLFQQRVMYALGEGRALCRCKWSRLTYDAVGDAGTIAALCQWQTVKNLLARGLIESDNPSDQTKRFVLSDRGRFVLKRGMIA